MKKRLLCTAVPFFLLLMSGCNGDDEQVKEVPEDIPVEEKGATSQENTNQTTDAPFNFTHFDLDVDYAENQEFDLDYENERDEMEVELKDDKGSNVLKGDGAFEEVRPKFEQLTFDKDTPDEEVISAVTKAFELEEDYQRFELEVKFLDGTEKEYNAKS
ncbi:YusW family protein [Bacillus sinesaloumensis]|uniref:YusW family protein n=1 Tax=Litchfieldia sinesaloumensis TaxID=1926280 RepID=UPI001356711D|nr:YusW family protein [Bacillus sinesaloumensis]